MRGPVEHRRDAQWPGEPAAVEPAPGHGADLPSVLAAAPAAGWHGIAFRNGAGWPYLFRVREGYLIWTNRRATTEQRLEVQVALGILSEEDRRLTLAAVATTEADRQAALMGATAPVGIGEPDPYRDTDDGNAELFLREHSDAIRFCSTWDQWLVWAGTHWEPDQARQVDRRAKQFARHLYQVAAETPDDRTRTQVVKLARRLESVRARNALLESAKTTQVVHHRGLDTAPFLLNSANGTVDLRSGHLRPHARADLLTHCTGMAFDPTVTAPVWEEFLHTVFAGCCPLHSGRLPLWTRSS